MNDLQPEDVLEWVEEPREFPAVGQPTNEWSRKVWPDRHAVVREGPRLTGTPCKLTSSQPEGWRVDDYSLNAVQGTLGELQCHEHLARERGLELGCHVARKAEPIPRRWHSGRTATGASATADTRSVEVWIHMRLKSACPTMPESRSATSEIRLWWLRSWSTRSASSTPPKAVSWVRRTACRSASSAMFSIRTRTDPSADVEIEDMIGELHLIAS
jgi:hypothetical protein